MHLPEGFQQAIDRQTGTHTLTATLRTARLQCSAQTGHLCTPYVWSYYCIEPGSIFTVECTCKAFAFLEPAMRMRTAGDPEGSTAWRLDWRPTLLPPTEWKLESRTMKAIIGRLYGTQLRTLYVRKVM